LSEPANLLVIADLVAGYGKKKVLNGVSIDVPRGEIIALIGHNGAGKSTVLKAIFGLLPIWDGRVLLAGEPAPARPRKLLEMGVSYLPQGNRVFTDLTVRENLRLSSRTLLDTPRADAASERILELFPALEDRLEQRAGTLSGGEKQMLALANALVLSPRLLLLDEPSLGLAPPLVREAFQRLRKISATLGATVLIVEQKVREVLKIAHYVYVLRTGRVSFSGPAAELSDEAILRRVYL